MCTIDLTFNVPIQMLPLKITCDSDPVVLDLKEYNVTRTRPHPSETKQVPITGIYVQGVNKNVSLLQFYLCLKYIQIIHALIRWEEYHFIHKRFSMDQYQNNFRLITTVMQL